MKRIAFLTLHDPTRFVIDDNLAIAPLAERGYAVETIPWDRAGVNWADYSLAIIRSTWDYQHHAKQFLATLADIERATKLENPLDIVRWNMQKTYVRDLEASGIVRRSGRGAMDI